MEITSKGKVLASKYRLDGGEVEIPSKGKVLARSIS